MADTAAQIKRQIEYYFSNSNIVKDKFLKQQIGMNADGWVALSVMAAFPRLKKLSEDSADYANALKESETMDVSEDGKMIRRKEPIPESYDALPRTVYVKPVPTAWDLDKVNEYFAQFGTVLKVTLRFDMSSGKDKEDKPRKESVFVEFKTEEECAAFVAKEDVECEGQKLEKVMKATKETASKKRKREDGDEGGGRGGGRRGRGRGGGRGRGRGGGRRGGRGDRGRKQQRTE